MRKKRTRRILLLPFLIPMFILGWILYVLGEPRTDRSKVPQRRMKNPPKQTEPTTEDHVEMGLMSEVDEEQAKVK